MLFVDLVRYMYPHLEGSHSSADESVKITLRNFSAPKGKRVEHMTIQVLLNFYTIHRSYVSLTHFAGQVYWETAVAITHQLI